MERPKIGVGVLVIKEGGILLGKRLGSHGENTWSLPGGHLEYGESIEECAIRETMEETGVEITNVQFSSVNNIMMNGKHYVTIVMKAEWSDGDPGQQEEKFLSPEWFALDDLPDPLFAPSEDAIKCYRDNSIYSSDIQVY